ncbi:chloramphenicol resistance permease RarD [Marinibactrum halimedae]|uniref:Chloramphenicol resistance permease RarD n=2 Tax=Marinibactrum halimedae TaxID=1444977 RepID=A0AA37T5L1_9GAMM|nr:chloramphenicol resistance permease RarD [Marinibactrum halimedae]
MWALAPIYFKALNNVSALDVLAHRVIWSFLLTFAILFALRKHRAILSALSQRRTALGLLASTTIIALNWGVFIWAIQENRILSASLGYYINPIISVFLGMMFLGERLNLVRKIAIALCLFAVVLEIVRFGSVPYIALFLATSFGLYGLIRKRLGVDSFVGMAVETGLLCPLAIGYILLSPNDSARLINNEWQTNMLLFLAGPVSMLPLLCFSAAANRISLGALGFFQYIGPTGMFILAVLVYGETFSAEKVTTFSIIWIALLLLVSHSVRQFLKQQHRKPSD